MRRNKCENFVTIGKVNGKRARGNHEYQHGLVTWPSKIRNGPDQQL